MWPRLHSRFRRGAEVDLSILPFGNACCRSATPASVAGVSARWRRVSPASVIWLGSRESVCSLVSLLRCARTWEVISDTNRQSTIHEPEAPADALSPDLGLENLPIIRSVALTKVASLGRIWWACLNREATPGKLEAKRKRHPRPGTKLRTRCRDRETISNKESSQNDHSGHELPRHRG